uniref:Ig-like domain-containing protein n=1 Tax=Salmo trutta TaxID=8032 RepID=A0A674C9W5_SALTR
MSRIELCKDLRCCFCVLGVLCADWTALMPQSIKALKGSCVRIPCSFTLGSSKSVDYNPCLKTHSCNAIWMRGGPDKTNTVGSSPSGNLNQKDCTTILDNMPTGDTYYLRLECGTCLSILDVPPTPTLTPATVEVREGTSVSLICSAAAPCPSLHPTLTWTPSLGQSVERLQENQDKTQVKTSSLTFTASYLHHEQYISCTALYKRQDDRNVKSPETSLTVTVLYPPKNISVSVSPSSSLVEGSSVTLTCNSNANPAGSYTWYRVNQEQVTEVGSSRMLTIKVPADNSQFYCETRNRLGSQNSSVTQLDGMCKCKIKTNVHNIFLLSCLIAATPIQTRERHASSETQPNQTKPSQAKPSHTPAAPMCQRKHSTPSNLVSMHCA